MRLADYLCPEHGPRELLADGDADAAPCDLCGAASPWIPAPVRGRVQLLTAVSMGRSDYSHAGAMDRPEVGDIRSPQDFVEVKRKADAASDLSLKDRRVRQARSLFG